MSKHKDRPGREAPVAPDGPTQAAAVVPDGETPPVLLPTPPEPTRSTDSEPLPPVPSKPQAQGKETDIGGEDKRPHGPPPKPSAREAAAASELRPGEPIVRESGLIPPGAANALPVASPAPFESAHHTRCRVVTTGSVIATGLSEDGVDTKHAWRGGAVAWFADGDVLSLPGILVPLD